METVDIETKPDRVELVELSPGLSGKPPCGMTRKREAPR
jgi:hypothetical protein